MLSKYRGYTKCKACAGSRVRTSARQVFIDKMNSKGYGGHNDWRLPTRTELETLIEYAKKDGWGDKEGHYVSDFLVSKGFINIQPEYYMTNNYAFHTSLEVARMWSGYFEKLTLINLPGKGNAYILPVRNSSR